MATNFVPFQQSSLFSNIAGGSGQPIGAVPMDFAKATPYVWNPNPVTPDPEVPESGFDMETFCSMPANAGHPMCVQQNPNDTTDMENKKIKIEGTDRYTTDNNFIPTDEEIAGMSNDEYIDNLIQRGWLKNSALGYLPSKGNMVELRKGTLINPYLTMAFGKEQEAKRKKIIEELVKRQYNVRGTADKTSFHLQPNAQTGLLSAGNEALGITGNQVDYQLEQLRQKNKDRILGGNPHADTYSYNQIINDAIQSGGTINPHELNFTASPQNYTSAQSQAGAGLLNQGNPHMMYNKKKKKYEKQYAGDY
tara:strand:- start:14745 stop:15665 length:921 start_codon:yes stop_codon:yes gene_type:complete